MPISPAQLALLTHRQWALPALAELHQMEGAKFITLMHRLNAHHAAVRQTLNELIALGLAVPNPGYGHPLRPEFVLTPAGEQVGPACVRVQETLRRLRLVELSRRKWTLPTVLAVHRGYRRFGEIRGVLVTATDRALAISLERLTGADVLTMAQRDGRTLRTGYCAAPAAAAIGRSLDLLPALSV